MLKIEKLLDEQGLSLVQITRLMGSRGMSKKLDGVLDGRVDFTSLSLDTLASYARGLGVPLSELLEDYEMDGTSSQVNLTARLAGRITHSINKFDPEYVKNNRLYINFDGKFTSNLDKNLVDNLNEIQSAANIKDKKSDFSHVPPYMYACFVEMLDGYNFDNIKYKTEYEFINPELPHSEQNILSSLELWEKYREVHGNIALWNRRRTPMSLISQDHYTMGRSAAIIQYTPLKNGGDLKLGVDIFDGSNEYLFSEIYGAEWINKDNLKEVIFYKSHLYEPLDEDTFINSPKKQISEFEFYRALNTQCNKFKIAKM